MPSPRLADPALGSSAATARFLVVLLTGVSACSQHKVSSRPPEVQNRVVSEGAFVFSDRLLFGSVGSLTRFAPSAGAGSAAAAWRAGEPSLTEGSDHLIWQAWASSGGDPQGSPLGSGFHSWDLTDAALRATEQQAGLAVPGGHLAHLRTARGAARRVLALPDFVSIHPGWDCPVHSALQQLALMWRANGNTLVSGTTQLLMPPDDVLREKGCVWVPALNCLAVGTAAFSVASRDGTRAEVDTLGGLSGRAGLADACGRASWFLQSASIGRTFDSLPQGFVFSPERVFSIVIYDQPAASLAEALLSGPPVASFPPRSSCADLSGRCLVSPLDESSCLGCSNLAVGQRYWVFLVEGPGQLNESTRPIEIVVAD